MNSKLTQIAAQAFRKLHPEMYEEYKQLTIPILHDINEIDSLLKFLDTKFERKPENNHFLIAIIYFLYCPFKLSFPLVRMPNGIRDTICLKMQWKDKPTCNYYAIRSTIHWKNPRFRVKVENIVNEFLTSSLNPNNKQ